MIDEQTISGILAVSQCMAYGQKMNTDKYMAIGHSHRICEDYALSGDINSSLSYAMISDGCSGSPDTDVGARIVSYSFLKNLRDRFASTSLDQMGWESNKNNFSLKYTMEEWAQNSIFSSCNIVSKMNVSRLCLDCTIVVALSSSSKSVIMFFGDGAAIVEHLDGSKTCCQISYENDMPYYISYFLEDNRRLQYISQCNPKASKRTIKFFKDGSINSDCLETHEVSKYDPIAPHFWSTLIIDDASSIVVTSDGIKSFQKDKKASIDSLDIAKRLSAFKNYNGQFIQRRLNRMQDELKKENISHYDDFSVAGIKI